MTSVSVIIPSINRPALLEETIASVLAGTELPAEIIVVDQSDVPNERVAALSRPHCDVRYVWTQAAGVSRARNRGIRLARHALLAFIDDDVRVHPDWLANLVRAATAAGRGAVVSGRVVAGAPAAGNGFVPSTVESDAPVVYQGRIRADVLFSGNMMLHRSLLDEIGEFDERIGPGTRFPAAEDNDFAHRLLEHGGRIHYAPEAILEHRAWRTAREYLPLRWRYGRGQGAFYAKHLDLRDRYMLGRLRYDVTQRGIRFFRLVVRDRRRSIGQLVYLGGLLSGVAQWLLMPRRHDS